MLAHRFTEHLAVVSSASFDPSQSSAFLPVSLGSVATPGLQVIQEIYRIAAERTQAQLQPVRSFRMPAFSRN